MLSQLLRTMVDRAGGCSRVAKAIGVTRGAVGNWVRGEREPSIPRLRDLLDACHATDAERLAILQSGTSAASTPEASAPVPSTGRDSTVSLGAA